MKGILYSIAVSICVFSMSVGYIHLNTDSTQSAESAYMPEPSIHNKRVYEYERHKDPATGRIPKNILSLEQKFVNSLYHSSGFKKDNALQATDGWMQRGPYNIGGRVRAFAMDISDKSENTLLAAGVSGGVWRTTDGGESWVKTTAPSQLHSISCIAQDTRPGKENIWYCGTGEVWGNSADINGDGLYKSTDGGRSWKTVESTITNKPNEWDNKFEYIWKIVVNHTNLTQDEVLVATALGGIYRSIDGGNTWETVLGGNGNQYSLFTDLAISNTGVIYASLSQYSSYPVSSVKGIFRSTNGKDWADITPENFPTSYKRIIASIAPSDENIVYFIGDTPGFGQLTFNSAGDSMYHTIYKYTYVSGDGSGAGGNWEERSENLPSTGERRHQFNSQGSYNLVTAVKPDNPNVYFVGAVNLDRSVDGFLTSTNTKLIGGTCPDNTCIYYYRYPNHHSDVHALFFSPTNSNVLYSGSDGGVHKTLDCMADKVEWISMNNGFFTTQFYTIAINKAVAGDFQLTGGLQDNGTLLSTQNDIKHHWTHTIFGDGFYCAIANDGKTYYGSCNSTPQPKIQVYRYFTDENGNTVRKTRIDPVGGLDFIWNTPFVLDPNNNNNMYLCGGKIIWRNTALDQIPDVESKDSTAIGWDSLQYTRIPSGNMSAVAISKSPANVLYYGTSTGRLFKINNALAAEPQPIEITHSSFPKQSNISCIEIDNHDANRIIVAFSNYNIQSIYYTEDGGINWTPISGNLEENIYATGAGPAVHWVKMLKLPSGEYRYFAGTSAGLFSTSYLKGKYTIWEQEGKNEIGNVVINMLDAREADGWVAVGTHATGTFTKIVNTTNDLVNQQVIPTFPANNAMGVPDYTELRWEEIEGLNYSLQISNDPTFTNIIIDTNLFQSNIYYFENLELGRKTYYWRVSPISAGGIGQASEVFNFTTSINPPALVYPQNASTDISVEPTLKWEAVANAKEYKVQLSRSAIFVTLLADTVLNSLELKVKDLENNKKYYWRAAAIDEGGAGEYASYFTFTTTSITSVEDIFNMAAVVFVGNCFPNPFTETSQVPIELAQSCDIKIKIYDTKGKLVKTMDMGHFESGKHSLKLESYNLSTGSYTYYIEAGKQIIKKTMLITK